MPKTCDFIDPHDVTEGLHHDLAQWCRQVRQGDQGHMPETPVDTLLTISAEFRGLIFQAYSKRITDLLSHTGRDVGSGAV